MGLSQSLTIYKDRLGVLIGREGSVKKRLEEKLKVKLTIDSKTGQIEVEDVGGDVAKFMSAVEVIKAIGLGFSPQRAEKLLQEDYSLYVIDLTEAFKDEKDIVRVKGRIIGEGGKTRRLIEETTGVDISIYRDYVSMIGRFEDLLIAKEAIEMLLKGRPHKAVYSFLFEERRRRKLDRMRMWE